MYVFYDHKKVNLLKNIKTRYFLIKGKGDIHFPSADASISGAIYNLMAFYNEQQHRRNDGVLFDLKFVNLLLKGIFGFSSMSEMDPEEPDFDDPKMMLAKGNGFCQFFFLKNEY